MTWMNFPHALRRRRSAPQALVVLLHDLGSSAEALTAIAARWSATVPTTVFNALDGVGELATPPEDPRLRDDAGAKTRP